MAVALTADDQVISVGRYPRVGPTSDVLSIDR